MQIRNTHIQPSHVLTSLPLWVITTVIIQALLFTKSDCYGGGNTLFFIAVPILAFTLQLLILNILIHFKVKPLIAMPILVVCVFLSIVAAFIGTSVLNSTKPGLGLSCLEK